jgi:ABC-type antimicrobial peptide transport system permease subunit
MDALVKTSEAQRRFAFILFDAFGVTALILAAIGIYGVLAGSVSERTREIGLRAALGASRREIVGMILRQGMTMTGVGVAIGLIGAALASRALITLLFGISRLDPATYAFVVVLLLATSLGACALPAWRAARVDPSITLRSE